MGNWLTRFPNTCIGVLWPAYMTYKALARAGNEAADIPVAEHSRWLRYWVMYGMMSIAEGPCDVFLSIVPGYAMAKLALLYWMAHPQTKGSEWMYENVASDVLQRNEMQIDAFALQVRAQFTKLFNAAFKRGMAHGAELARRAPAVGMDIVAVLSPAHGGSGVRRRRRTPHTCAPRRLAPVRELALPAPQSEPRVLRRYGDEDSELASDSEVSDMASIVQELDDTLDSALVEFGTRGEEEQEGVDHDEQTQERDIGIAEAHDLLSDDGMDDERERWSPSSNGRHQRQRQRTQVSELLTAGLNLSISDEESPSPSQHDHQENSSGISEAADDASYTADESMQCEGAVVAELSTRDPGNVGAGFYAAADAHSRTPKAKSILRRQPLVTQPQNTV